MIIYSKKREEYKKTPKLCKICKTTIAFERRKRCNFCTVACRSIHQTLINQNKRAINQKICKECGNPLSGQRKIVCSPICQGLRNARNNRHKHKTNTIRYQSTPKLCKHCKTPLSYEKRKCKTCSVSCANTLRPAHKKEKYYKTPNSCNRCNSALPYELRTNSFCSVKCYSITRRTTAQGKYEKNPTFCGFCKKPIPFSKHYKIKKHCNWSCGSKHTQATFRQNGYKTVKMGFRRKAATRYFNPYENKEVILDSTWEVEVADYLIEQNIEWVRPSPIPWTDSFKKDHLYFPDFFLPKYDLYLDPKNPWIMKRDKEKMATVSKTINIEYGHIDKIMSLIKNLI